MATPSGFLKALVLSVLVVWPSALPKASAHPVQILSYMFF